MHNSKRMYSVSTSGTQSGLKLIEPGVTNIDDGQGGDTYKLGRNVKIHVHAVDLKLSNAGEVTLKIGNQEIFKHGVTAAEYIHYDMVDRYANPIDALNISVTTNITVTGTIQWSFEPYGSKPVTGVAVNQSVTGA